MSGLLDTALSRIINAVSFRPFRTEDQIKEFVAHYPDARATAFCANDASHDPARLQALLIYSTTKLHTWLVADESILHCVIDDVRKEEPVRQWILGRGLAAPVTVHDRSDDGGILEIGTNRKLLFSKTLFPDADIIPALGRLVEGAAANSK